MPRKPTTIASELIIYFVVILVCVYAIFPIYWGASTSLKKPAQILSFPIKWIPKPPTLEHYHTVISKPSGPRYFINSVLVSLARVALVLFVASLAGYAAAKMDFAGKNIIMLIPLVLWMVPMVSILTPLYMITARFNLLDTYTALILIGSVFEVPIAAWLLRSFFQEIPHEIDDAAMIDGCSKLQVLYRVVLPLSWPGLFACALLVFVRSWNSFLVAYTFISSEEKMVVQIGLYRYITEYGINWGALMTFVTLALLPPAFLFIALQKHFVHALSGSW